MKELAIPAILVVVGVGAFVLGRLSAMGEQKGSAAIQTPSTQSTSPPSAGQTGQKNFVASKSGTKYYAVGCAGTARIKPENEVWFSSVAQAQAAGYSEAANCNR